MKVIAIKEFKDKKEKVLRKVGDTFTVSKARYEEIISAGEFVEEVKEETKEK